jgi:hypothetical protein
MVESDAGSPRTLAEPHELPYLAAWAGVQVRCDVALVLAREVRGVVCEGRGSVQDDVTNNRSGLALFPVR